MNLGIWTIIEIKRVCSEEHVKENGAKTPFNIIREAVKYYFADFYSRNPQGGDSVPPGISKKIREKKVFLVTRHF